MLRVGRLVDYPTTDADGDYGRRALALAFETYDCVVEVIDADAVGDPAAVVAAARRLAAAGCVLLLGPSVTHGAVPLVPVLDALEVPALNWCGSALARGPWSFQLKVGSLPDEAGYLAHLVARRGYPNVAIARDEGPIGDEYVASLRPALAALGVEIAAEVPLSDAAAVDAPARMLCAARPACVLYLGLGPCGRALAAALRAVSWRGPIAGNIGLGVMPSPDVEGVVFTDVVDDENPVLARFVGRYAARYGSRPLPLGLAAAHDLAMTTAAAIRAAPAPTPAGIRAGLESLRGLPAAVGAPGTTIGFAPFDRDGYKGPLVVYREVRDGRAVRYRP